MRYGPGPEVLRDLTFRIDPRSFQFLTGPSGAGKTSLLRLLFLSLRPTRGLVTLFGHDIATLSKDALATLRRRIGIVFQDFRLLDHMTTYENVALPLRVIGQAEDSYREEVVELLNWVGLGDRMSALPPVLSGRREAARGDRTGRDRAARSSCLPTSPRATSIPTWRNGCCGCSSNSTSPARRSSSPPTTSR